MNKKIPFILSFIVLLSSQLCAQQTIGLFLNDSLSVNGYTLFTNNKTTYLIDNCGFVVNTWESGFSSNTSNYLLENGNLLRTARVGGIFSGGGIAGRIEMFNWEGDLLWWHHYASPDYHQHHDIEPLPNGNILILAWEARSVAEAIQAGRNSSSIGNEGVWPEHIIEVEMVGNNEINIVWEWHLWDHLVQEYDSEKDNFGIVADHPELVDVNFSTQTGSFPGGNADWIHANAVAYHPGLDQIAISSRSFSEVWVIDHSTTSAEAAGHSGGKYGKGGDLLYRWGNPQAYDRGTEDDRTLWVQHNITWILEEDHPQYGKFLVYNNGAGRPGGNHSTVDVWTPPIDMDGHYSISASDAYGPASADWSFSEPGFYSANISGVHALPSGHFFVCEGTQGRFFEITQEGQIVWEYINPVSQVNGPMTQGQNPTQNPTFRATRYPADYPALEGKDLTPTAPVELNPLPSDCIIFGEPTSNSEHFSNLQDVWIRSNPVSEELNIVNETGKLVFLEIFDQSGKKITNLQSADPLISLQMHGWPNGFYLLRISNEKRTSYFTQKFVKF